MPEIIANKLHQLDLHDLISLLRSIQMEDSDAFQLIKEKLEDL
jgi:hypothetical protein